MAGHWRGDLRLYAVLGEASPPQHRLRLRENSLRPLFCLFAPSRLSRVERPLSPIFFRRLFGAPCSSSFGGMGSKTCKSST
jgi:hypothetical protein